MKVAINLGLILETLNEEQLASRWTVQVGVKKKKIQIQIVKNVKKRNFDLVGFVYKSLSLKLFLLNICTLKNY